MYIRSQGSVDIIDNSDYRFGVKQVVCVLGHSPTIVHLIGGIDKPFVLFVFFFRRIYLNLLVPPIRFLQVSAIHRYVRVLLNYIHICVRGGTTQNAMFT